MRLALSLLSLVVSALSANMANAAPWSFDVNRTMAGLVKDKCTVGEAMKATATASEAEKSTDKS